MRDLSRGSSRYNSPTFCGVCDPESRDNRDYLVKGTYFLSTDKLGSHNVVVGLRQLLRPAQGEQLPVRKQLPGLHDDDDPRRAATSSPSCDSQLVRLLHADHEPEQGHGLADPFRLRERLLASQRPALAEPRRPLGQEPRQGQQRRRHARTTARSARASARTWDVTGNGARSRVARELREVRGRDPGQPRGLRRRTAGSASTFIWYYDGPGATPINVESGAGCPARDARAGVSSRSSTGSSRRAARTSRPASSRSRMRTSRASRRCIHGLSELAVDDRGTRSASAGNVGSAFAYRVDLVRREGRDFYNNVINGSTGTGTDDSFGNTFDVGYINNTNSVERNYTGLHTSLSYRKGGFQRRPELDLVAHARKPQRRGGGVGAGSEHDRDVSRIQGPGLEQPLRVPPDRPAPPREGSSPRTRCPSSRGA